MRGIVVAALVLLGCGSDDKSAPAPAPVVEAQLLSEEDALRVAQKDALEVYKKLDHYEVRSELKDDGWHIDYLLPKAMDGGGASYVIDARSGAILTKKYQQ
jgi:hypothetical protein